MNVRSEDGFTIVETVVAAILLAIGAIAVLGAFDGAPRATFRAEQSQVASDIAQREVEALRAKPYTQLALTSAPATSGDSDNPSWRVVGSNFALNDDRTNQSPIVVQGGSLTGGGTVTGASVTPSTARSTAATSRARSTATSSGATTPTARTSSAPARRTTSASSWQWSSIRSARVRARPTSRSSPT